MLRKWQKKFILLTISARNQSKTQAEASQRRPCFLFGHEDYVAVKALGGECYQIKSKYNPYSCFGSHSKKCEKCQIQLRFWILYQKAQKSIGKRFDENRKPINTLCKKISFSLVSLLFTLSNPGLVEMTKRCLLRLAIRTTCKIIWKSISIFKRSILCCVIPYGSYSSQTI